jgi:hypothetical protein
MQNAMRTSEHAEKRRRSSEKPPMKASTKISEYPMSASSPEVCGGGGH